MRNPLSTWSLRRRWGVLLAAAVLAVTPVVGAIAPAAAAPAPTVCNGSEIHHYVSGNLTVPDHATCVLTDLAVHGTITVGRYAALDLTGVDVGGNVVVAARSMAAVYGNSLVIGGVYFTHAAGVAIDESSVKEAVIGTLWTPAGGDSPGFTVTSSTIGGDIDVAGPVGTDYSYFFLSDVSITGGVRLSGMQALSQGPVHVAGSLNLNRYAADPFTASPAQVCGWDVVGNATVEYTSAVVNFGDVGCPSNTIGGALLLHDNTGVIRLTGSIGGNLVCRRNLHHPRELRPGDPALAIKVGGHKLGQCAALV